MGDLFSKIMPVNANDYQITSGFGSNVRRVNPGQQVAYKGGEATAAGVEQYNQEWISGIKIGDSYFTNNPDKTKSYSQIPTFMMKA